MVYFVGAGTGAPDLITVRGRRYLEQADVIIYAGSLVNPELLSYAKKEDTEDENEAKAKIAALTIVLTQLAASEEKRMDEEKKNSDIHENVQKTSEYIQKINDITKQLDKIEKNQKILALNASIEAARAGEAGKGFAIVATNVSALATDFGNNNREIKDELQKLNEVIAAIEKCE